MLERVQTKDPYGDGRPAVWPEIPTQAVDYVMVGEAPGKNEVKKGVPFIGNAGTLARGLAAEAGLGNVHYTNASLFRPAVGKKDKPPAAAIFKKERPRLYMEISMCKPRAVICVGAVAAEAVLGNVPRMRGMVRELVIHGQRYLVYVTWHPSAIFYKPDFYRDVVTDFSRAANLEVPERYVSESLISGKDEVRFSDGEVSIDAEGTSVHPVVAELLLVTVRDSLDRTYIFFREDASRLADAVGNYSGGIVGHNAPYDEILLRRTGIPVRFTDDTILQHYSQDERKGSHKLKVLGPTVAKVDTGVDLIWPYTHGGTGEEEDDEERVEWKDIPREVLAQYCAGDTKATARLRKALNQSSDGRTQGLYKFLMRGYRAFVEGQYQGIRVDREALRAATADQEQKVASLLGEFDFNPESHPQTLAAFRAAGYKVESVAKDVLKDLEGELPRKLEKFREENKTLTGFLRPLNGWKEKGIWIPGWVEKDGRAHPVIKLYGTDSGRTSCSDPNIQQIPPELRHLFIADDGHVLLGWDYKSHEVRGLGYYTQDPKLLEILRPRDADPHQYIASIVGVERQTAKHSLFGVAYGAGAPKLVKQHGIPLETATRIVKLVGDLFPGLDKWREMVYNEMYDLGYVETPYHRRRHFLYLDKRNVAKARRIAVNYKVQSLCGDIAFDSAIQVYEQMMYAPLIFVHDFNAIQIKEDDVDVVKSRVEEIASSILPNEWVEFVPELYVARSWGAMKHAAAEPIIEEAT